MADTDNLNEELRTYKPHFRWGKYGRDALVFILDAFLLFVASLIVFAFLLYVILQGRIDISSFSASNWVDIVGHVAWPLLVFITVFLLRNPLRQLIYEAEGFIGRSYIRQGTLFVPASSQNSQPVCGAETKESRSVKEKAIRFLEEQYGFEILRKRSLKGGRYSFDGVVRLNGITYCIAIKHSKDKTPQYFSRDEMNEVMGKVRGVFLCATPEIRKDFVFMICIVAPEVQEELAKELMNYMEAQEDLCVRFRFFEYGQNGQDIFKEVFIP